MNRGIREQHTETLRERVRQWHGSPDAVISEDLSEQPDKNLPYVGSVSFSSAPDMTAAAFGPEEDEFRVIPRQLANDRYLEDLLENHASDLREQKEYVHELQRQFDFLRQRFCEEFDYAPEVEYEEFSLVPQEYLSRWFFEHLIRLERGSTDDFSTLRERMISEISGTGRHPDSPIIWIRAAATTVDQRAIYGARYNVGSKINQRNINSELTEEVEEIIREIVADVQSEYPIETVHQAADTLDEGVVAVDELEQILLEYDGKPVYQGDCKYLREAKVNTESS